ncbi:hypothetical protein BC567DRAFT_206712 [Phyllosticta citribraziliensis]
MSPTSDTPFTSNSPIVRNMAARASQSFAMSPTSDTTVASNSPFVRNLIARALRRAPRMDASAFNITPSQLPVAEENNEASEGASTSTGRLSGNTLGSNRKRRASALEGTAANRPQHSNRTPAPVAIENELEDYDEEERNGSIVTGSGTHANELEDYNEEERNGSVVASPPIHTNELEDYNETLGNSSNASLPPSPKKLCTGLSNKVLVIDGEKFLLPEGRGDVVTLEHDEAMFGRLGHTMRPKVIVIDGQRFLLPRGGGEVVAMGRDERMWMEEVQQREFDYAGVEEGDRQQEQETDTELEDWINNYHCYMDSRDGEGQVLQDEQGLQKEHEINDLDQFRSEEPGTTYLPNVEEGEQTMQNDTTGPSSENSLCIYCGEYHLSEQSDCEDSESNASEPASENSLCPQCGVYHPPGQMESDASDSDTTEPLGYFLCNNCGEYHLLSEDEEESTESDEHEDSSVYDNQDANFEADINNDEVPPTDSGYDSEMDEEDDSDSSDSSDSDSSLGSDESVDWDYDYDNVGGGNTNAQAPALVVDDPILYGPTDLPEGHVRGDMMFVMNGELWGIDFRN